MSVNSFIFRCKCAKSDRKRDAGLTTPSDVTRDDNIAYKDGLLLDIYRPQTMTTGSKLPVLISVHGGGWTYGNKEIYQYYCMSLVKYGFAVVNFNYRLAPRHKFPAAIEDTGSVMEWVMDNAAEFNLDTERIYMMGDSAGAQICGLYSSLLTNSEYLNHMREIYNININIRHEMRIRALLLNCGSYLTEGKITDYLKDYLPIRQYRDSVEKLMQDASVIYQINANFPPCFVMTSNKDFLHDDAFKLTDVLDKYGVHYVRRVYGDDSNPLYHVFHCNIKTQIANEVNREECEFLKSI